MNEVARTDSNLVEDLFYTAIRLAANRGDLSMVKLPSPAVPLNAQKEYLSSTYEIPISRPSGELLGNLDCGKACMRSKRSVEVPDTAIGALISRAMRRQGSDIDC